jgi:hypothetical protein
MSERASAPGKPLQVDGARRQCRRLRGGTTCGQAVFLVARCDEVALFEERTIR